MINNIIFYTLFFCLSDSILNYFNIKGIYYFNHVLANIFIINKSYDNSKCYLDDILIIIPHSEIDMVFRFIFII